MRRQALIAATLLLALGPRPGAGQTAAATTYQVISRLSQASYAVDEVFLQENNRLFTAVGITPGVSGEIILDRSRPGDSRIAEIVVDLQQLKSDSDRRDRAIRRKYLESDRYPYARLTNVAITGLPPSIVDGTPFRYSLDGDLNVHDVTRRITWEGEATITADTLRGVARTRVLMSTFGIEVPRLLALRSEDEVRLEIRFVALARNDNIQD